jgi:hypothetical protein
LVVISGSSDNGGGDSGRLPAERVYSTVFDAYRGRVEKIFAKVTCHRLFKGKNHLHFRTLVSCVHITLHTTALWTRYNPQYPGYGNWPHFQLNIIYNVHGPYIYRERV